LTSREKIDKIADVDTTRKFRIKENSKMALVTSKEMFEKAYAGGYAVGAFNVDNMEIVQAITEACREEKAPVNLQVSKGARA
jgi:hypothetical protein